MAEAYIVGAVRTPVGKKKGGLSAVHPVDLAAHTLQALVERTGVDPAAVDDVIMGCVMQFGPQSMDIARNAWLSAGLPETVAGVTIDRQCGSSQQAIHFAAQGVLSGTQDLVVAAGVESMSIVPMGSSISAALEKGMPFPFGDKWVERYGKQEISQFRGAELMCEKWGLERDELERYAYESHQRAAKAIANGHFRDEIAPVNGVADDEGPRPDTTLEKMAGLKTLREGGRITAATSSQISDGSGALLIASEQAVREHGLVPRARIVTLALTGDDPVYMLTAPIPATRRALAKAGLTIGDIDVIEINEAFAPVPLAWLKEIGADPARTNPNGGAIALGHPLGGTGAILMTKLLHELERTGGRYGLQTMCEGGGQANVTIIERL
ncbi:acetyl-CoA C-acetyltransferase [Microbispora bryophytorum]|uniref:Acetyl-CoA acetyltransferase n=2 Tax=Microbispora bryophytorum TaxID=1460882 RepID=A0A8H9GW29_9ACTN|nr:MULTISPECIES: acetyl-CoA C-acetyltransferase [Microbispora]MBD3139688.1 acetyl-CoA C-acetyltransferase [Microbispora bryophytorum]MBD3147708.1 acetyl-CoA C-acetyltransferase [Microbispora camponoti]TQS02969.1 acetyl-CoA C-acetyltransferase [Microbispora bryophytorum]GGO03325.1 acetyl-CoA acetyltransferase [Microbispora bryophytorum]